MFWLLFGITLIASAVFVAWKFGIFDKFEMQKGRLMGCEILYLPFSGEYSKIGPLFEEVSRDTKTVFKFSQNFGFYFDNPEVTVPQKCRAIVGILVNEGQEFKINQFISQHPGYKRFHLSTTRYLSYEMPYVNIFSILIMIKKIYPKINEYMKKEDTNESECSGIMELYKCVRSDKKIEIILPLQNKSQFMSLIAQNQEKDGKNDSIEKGKEQRVLFSVDRNQNHMMRQE